MYRSVIGIGVSLLALVAEASGQGVTVPIIQCYNNCAHPQDVNTCCSPNWFAATCTRFDSAPVVVFAGTETVFPGSGYEHECANCCKYKPNECPGNDIYPEKRDCFITPALTWTESISLSVSASVTIGAGAVESKLQAGVGVVLGSEATVSFTCPVSAPKCKSVATQPSISFLAGRSARIDHTWQASGVWINYPGVGCNGVCPIAGNPWIVGTSGCWQTYSTAIGDDLLTSKCGSLYPKECPDPDPCSE